MAGTTQTQEALSFIISFAMAIDRSLEDGRFDVSDVAQFVDPLLKLVPAVEDASEIPSEITDLDAEEAEALRVFVSERFDIRDDQLEEIIEEGLSAAVALLRFYLKIRGIGTSPSN